jgi:hypothetical protein
VCLGLLQIMNASASVFVPKTAFDLPHHKLETETTCHLLMVVGNRIATEVVSQSTPQDLRLLLGLACVDFATPSFACCSRLCYQNAAAEPRRALPVSIFAIPRHRRYNAVKLLRPVLDTQLSLLAFPFFFPPP